jgi:integrase
LRWEWEIAVPKLETSVFLIPAGFGGRSERAGVKNRDERLMVLNSVTQSVIEKQRGKHVQFFFPLGQPDGEGNETTVHRMKIRPRKRPGSGQQPSGSRCIYGQLMKGSRISASTTGPVSSKTVTKQLGDRQRSAEQSIIGGRSINSKALLLPAGKWTPHDLRRTGATMMTAIGVLPEVAERCLNHLDENKIKRTYQRHRYQMEMADAWRRLGNHLDALVSVKDCGIS